jgi:2-hydroxyglutaryl-CoA dehydratase, D-component
MSAVMNDSVAAVLRAPLDALREGGVGFVGPDIPVDLLLASGRAFGHLPWKAETDTSFADQWLESGFPGWSRSVLEQWHAGEFDGIDAVVFSRTDDASQRLYYYVRELQQRGLLAGPRPLILDLALVPREASFEHSAAAVGSLAADLGVDEKALWNGITRADALRIKLQQIQNGRAGDGVFFERLSRAMLWSDSTRWIEAVSMTAASGATRVLLAGSSPPDDRVHRAVDAGGAAVVAETHVHALGRLGLPQTVKDSDPFRHVARQLIANATGPRAFIDRAQWIVRHARDARATAVILWLTREEEALAWHVPAMRRALAEAGLPALVLPAASWRADDGAAERIVEFVRGAGS